MNFTAMNRLLGLTTVLLSAVLLAACVDTGAVPLTGTFTFAVASVPATGNPTSIDVRPLAPTEGLYGGGNARNRGKGGQHRRKSRANSSRAACRACKPADTRSSR